MKKLFIILLLATLTLSFTACIAPDDVFADDCVRIHIRANSNDSVDQSVKLLVRDSIVNYLTPRLAECPDSADAKRVIALNLANIENVANEVLAENNFAYTARATLSREEFPYREYSDYSFPAGVYDALIVNLGAGVGDNWWCVCFPPLCFIPDGEGENFEYKSKIVEIIKKCKR